jgi:hypothetical protein
MVARTALRFSCILLVASLATIGAGCGDSGYDDCVSNCESQYDCAGVPDQDNACAQGCEQQEEQADDHDCDGEWSDAQACMQDIDGCDFSVCQAEFTDWQECEMSYCSNNPNDPECHMDSAS